MKNANDYRALADAMDAITGAAEAKLARLAELQAAAIVAKNSSDELVTVKDGTDGIWANVYAIACIVEDATKDGLEDRRHDMLTDVLAQWIKPGNDEAGKPLKLSTVGQYASTARKALLSCTDAKVTLDSRYAGKSVADVRKSFRSLKDVAMLELAANAGKEVRYAIKHGDEAAHKELEELFSLISALYRPIKAKKDGASNKGKAAVGLPELQQQPPAEAGTVETVAADLADEGHGEEAETEKQAVGQ